MLCCVSRKAAEGSVLKKPSLISSSSSSLSSTSTVTPFKAPANKSESDPKYDDTVELLPCTICGRTFKPQSLEKHAKICERAAIKKRKPFDSFKQRLQGTELEEFLPKVITKGRDVRPEEKCGSRNTWKQTHDEFLRTIRAARGETVVTTSSQYRQVTTITPGAPTRSNEKGLCPTCSRQFGIKAYDRHVAWCKERILRVPTTQATNVAKERLDARMKYRAPLLKNRRMTNREKYAPRIKNNVTVNNNNINNNNNNNNINAVNSGLKIKDTSGPKSADPVNIKQPAVTERRSGQGKIDGVIAPGPVKSRPADRSIKGICPDYDPYLLAEQQLNDLLSDTCSDKSFTDSPSNRYNIKPTSSPSTSSSPLYPLTHSSAFVKYPNSLNLDNSATPEKRGSVLAPPSEFDDLSIGFSSSDSAETNSLSRELFAELESACRREDQVNKKNHSAVLGRRVIIDKARALGTTDESLDGNSNKRVNLSEKSRKVVEKTTVKPLKPMVTRSNSVRAASAPKIPERKETAKANSRSSPGTRFNNHSRNNNCSNLSGSNLSLSSIVSSEIDVKRSNSMFDDLVSSFDDDSGSYPSLRSFLKNDPLSMSSPVQASRDRTRNGQISDEDLSSPDCFKKQECNKLSADSAYSSLNRKYSNGRNETTGRLDEDTTLARRRENGGEILSNLKSKMSKFCHECGTKFPETAKFCCECGIQRLAL
ncbi:probable serine/threonine-protein kinase nek3 isoform X6 [Microplitis mediator]|uniref:probable serine/threonine-protein kinase nek3 isoform X6 n=1 Tax=Microplitis mediator TaxID=375433 RepID=UPI0025555ED8|nr:probable serine/threonine-protein kinase nek3 isoform X6 [Microplitis mediator]